MDKKIKVLIVIILIIIALFFGINFAINKARITNAQNSEQKSYELFKEIRQEVSNGNEDFRRKIKINLDKIITEYPDTKAAIEAQAFLKEYPDIVDEKTSEMLFTIDKIISYWNYTEEQKEEIETKANNLFDSIEKSALEYSGSGIDFTKKKIEEELNRLIKNYPYTKAAQKVEQFRLDYPSILEVSREQYFKKMEIEKVKDKVAIAKITAKREKLIEKFANHVKGLVGGSTIDANEWYDRFTQAERDKIYAGILSIGDRDIMVDFVTGRGYYKKTTSETAYGKSNQYYGVNGTPYSYITSKNGIIDYIAY